MKLPEGMDAHDRLVRLFLLMKPSIGEPVSYWTGDPMEKGEAHLRDDVSIGAYSSNRSAAAILPTLRAACLPVRWEVVPGHWWYRTFGQRQRHYFVDAYANAAGLRTLFVLIGTEAFWHVLPRKGTR